MLLTPSQRVAVYQLSEYLSFSKNSQDIAFDCYRLAVEKDWEIKDFLMSMNVILDPIRLSEIQLSDDQKKELRGKRILGLMSHHLHMRRVLQ
ncbi:uncharacterized protein BO97DRAFT_279253 [Aspergillus homomorphus CBS 101889]|uniref:Uncharacterized protein n=1 Tax=Aspergillus homomorphus (strain CBS 101889) TaxID=1450537 RepID=A0A395HIH5_ASPHC|nr:hypothetical protein BO97DRAFT_279253 [Aspergillus homomorphus CBS 101889]RAL06778.1 hypothetical protein BO97DRAFT_279253 [Aspergillus homomorphus CBS 101889]